MKKILFLIAFVLSASLSAAQSRVVSGVVTDSKGAPIIGVSIVVKGTTIGITSDEAGAYKLNVPSAASTLVFSYLGYSTREVEVRDRTQIDVRLEEDAQHLEQVVVVGYGVTKKSDLTGSVETIKADKLTMGAATNAAQMLRGRIPGLYINSHNQDPGTTADVMLRGVGSLSGGTQPLVVVDGFPSNDMSVLNTINPNDIEQMDILKDASATAIYGSRGANGVIIVTTKSGQRGGKLHIDYGGKFSTQTLARKIDVMNSEEYIRYYYDLAHDADFSLSFPAGNDGNMYPYPLESIGKVADTDWQKELTKKIRLTHDHNLSLSGGTENLAYRVSLNYYDGQGVVSPYDYRRLNSAAKLNYKKNRFAFSVDLAYTKENTDNVKNDFINAIRFAPTVDKFGEDGKLSLFPIGNMDWYNNPFYNEYNTENISEQHSTRMFYTASYELLPGLKVEARVGYEHKSKESYVYENEKKSSLDYGGIWTDSYTNMNVDAMLTYIKSFGGKHNLNFMAATNYQEFRNRGASMDGNGFSSPLIKYYAMSAIADKLNRNIDSYWNDRVNQSVLARLSYDYDNRYYLTVNYRLDGASQFGDDNKWGHFPSVALAWRINNEKFFHSDYITNLKLKVGYGLSGNANVPSGRSQALISYVPVYMGDQVLNGVSWSGGYIPNPNLRWEGAETLNAGIEFSGKHFSLDLNAYRKYSYDLLIDRPVPVESGYNKITLNKGELVNYGIEAKVEGFFTFLNGNLSWTPSFWFAYNHNRVQNFDGSKIQTLDVWDDKTLYGYAGLLQEGYAMGAIFGYDYAGVWQQNEAAEAAVYGAKPGDPKFLDTKTSKADGTVTDGPDGVIDEADKRYLGSIHPAVTLGFGSTLRYKNWSLSFMLDGVVNKKVVNYNRLYLLNPSSVSYGNLSREALDRWTPDHPNTNIPSFTGGVDKNLVTSTFCVEDATFFRLSEVTLAYQYNFKNSKFMRGFRVYLTGTNLATMTNYSGLNPDVSGIDAIYNLQPIPRTYLLGVNLMF